MKPLLLALSLSASLFAQVRIACWGDSLTAGDLAIPYPTQLQLLVPRSVVFNGGHSGNTSTQIAERMLAATDKYGDIAIIWAGTNNSRDKETVKSDIARMVAALTSNPKRYVVIGVYNSAAGPIGSDEYNAIVALNSDLGSIYSTRFLDIRTYLLAAYDPSQAQDVADRSREILPSSLRLPGDTVHLNTAGYGVVAREVARLVNEMRERPVPLPVKRR